MTKPKENGTRSENALRSNGYEHSEDTASAQKTNTTNSLACGMASVGLDGGGSAGDVPEVREPVALSPDVARLVESLDPLISAADQAYIKWRQFDTNVCRNAYIDAVSELRARLSEAWPEIKRAALERSVARANGLSPDVSRLVEELDALVFPPRSRSAAVVARASAALRQAAAQQAELLTAYAMSEEERDDLKKRLGEAEALIAAISRELESEERTGVGTCIFIAGLIDESRRHKEKEAPPAETKACPECKGIGHHEHGIGSACAKCHGFGSVPSGAKEGG